MVQALDEIISRDLPEAFQLLKEMKENVQQVIQLVDNMLVRVKRGEVSTDKGLSFLEMKYHMLLSYLINLTYVVLRKCSGKMIEGDPSIDRLVEIRTVLEKMRPIDHKLKYQIDKLVKTAVTGTTGESDPINFRANPANLNDSEESESGSDEEKTKTVNKQGKANKGGVYVPPKVAAVHYEGDETYAEKQQRLQQRARKWALGSSVIQELGEEYFDRPTEISQADVARATLVKQHNHRERYEEEYFTRLPITKKDRQRTHKMTTIGTLGDELTRFGDFSALEEGAGVSGSSGPSKKRKLPKGKKKSFKKRRFH